MTAPLDMPEAWKKVEPVPAAIPEIVVPPEWDDSPEVLAAFFGPFGHWEHWRSCVLSSARMVERAKCEVTGQKYTEAYLDHQMRLNPEYVAFLVRGLEGRIKFEQEVLKRGIGG